MQPPRALAAAVLSLALAHPTLAHPTLSPLEPLGLEERLTSISLYGNILAAGSNGDGVHWRSTQDPPQVDWNPIGLLGAPAHSVYAHKSGPLGWAIAAGVSPSEGVDGFVFCSFMGQAFTDISKGISSKLTDAVRCMSGFPDPSICGETYAAGGRGLYRRDFGSETWSLVFTASIEGYIGVVRARPEIPGIVLAGGGEGFAGALLVKSIDFGDTWANVSPPGFVRDLDFTGKADSDVIFVALGHAVYRSVEGSLWTEVFRVEPPGSGLITEVVIARVLDRVYIAGTGFAGASLLYASDDLGETWTRIPTGLTGSIVDLEAGDDGTLYLAHESAGVFRLSPENVHVPEPGVVAGLRVWPLPVRTGQRLHVEISAAGGASGGAGAIDIYDLAGRHVVALSPIAPSGTGGQLAATWDLAGTDGDGVAPGVYFVRWTGDGDARSMERKVVVTR